MQESQKMATHLVECIRLTKEPPKFTNSKGNVESDTPANAIEKFILDYLPLVGEPKIYKSELNIRPDTKYRSTNHFVSYFCEATDNKHAFFLRCRYTTPK